MLVFVYLTHLLWRYALVKQAASVDRSAMSELEDFLKPSEYSRLKVAAAGTISHFIASHRHRLLEAGIEASTYDRFLSQLYLQETHEHQAGIRSIRLQGFNGAIVSMITLLLLLVGQHFERQPEITSLKYFGAACLGQNIWFWLYIRLRPRLRLRQFEDRRQLSQLIGAWFSLTAGIASDFEPLRILEVEEIQSGVSQQQKKIELLKRINSAAHNSARTKRLMWQSCAPIFELVGLVLAGLPVIAIL